MVPHKSTHLAADDAHRVRLVVHIHVCIATGDYLHARTNDVNRLTLLILARVLRRCVGLGYSSLATNCIRTVHLVKDG